MTIQMLRVSFLPFLLLALLPHGAASAQAGAEQGESPGSPAQRRRSDLGTPAEEMLQRAAIRHEEETHREMVERADEAARLGDEILASFKRNNSLTRDDLKKIERLEKLARKIRGNAGGSDDEEGPPDPPGMIESAVERLAELSGILKKSVSKTSRLVISATVIERSNDIIELIRHIRTIRQP